MISSNHSLVCEPTLGVCGVRVLGDFNQVVGEQDWHRASLWEMVRLFNKSGRLVQGAFLHTTVFVVTEGSAEGLTT